MINLSKEEFLKEFGDDDYGYPNAPKNIDQIRDSDFNRLNGLVYLDHAGATLYSESQLEAVFKDLSSTVYGNPHSQSHSSSATLDVVNEARQQVLDYCHASVKDYKCIFTSGATAGLKLIGEAFPWDTRSRFMYTMENHNSVLGIREYALRHGADAFAINIEEAENKGGVTPASIKVTRHPSQRRKEAKLMKAECKGNLKEECEAKVSRNSYNLFAFPSECNFSGVRYSLDLVNIFKEDAEIILEGPLSCNARWMVLIDAAKGCLTEPPDLSKYPADFVVISFYKLFGYPTGLGALIVSNDAARLLNKTYFSGGTVAASIADIDFVKRRESFEELFEDGTTSFLNIASIRHGFKILNSLTASAISRHTTALSTYTRRMLVSLRHGNGANVCTLYGRDKSQAPFNGLGPVVSFNLTRPDGSWFGYREVEKLASLSAIQLRTGCFCNPGACAKYLELSHLDLLSNIEAGHVCWDDNDIVRGKPTGAVRVSFGYMSTFEDAKKFVEFVVNSFVSLPHQYEQVDLLRARFTSFPTEDMGTSTFCLKSITVYPIKSCAGFSIDRWPLSNTGLLYDREWLLKSLSGEILTQKKVPDMRLIRTHIDLSAGVLSVESPRCKTKLVVDLSSDACYGRNEEMNLHSHRYSVQCYTDDINAWFSNAIGRACSLLRCSGLDYYHGLSKCTKKNECRDMEARLNFVNEAQFLLISEDSIRDLNDKLHINEQRGTRGPAIQVNPMRFRPNLVISGGDPYVEDGWNNLKIGNKSFMSLGGCNRCQMINFDQQEGKVQKSNEPLVTLASYRRVKGKILFGILLRFEDDTKVDPDMKSWLQVGDVVHPI